MPGVAVIIPTLNEEAAIAQVIAELPRAIATEIIVADSGSTDGTQAAARAAGAQVLEVRERGYGRACAAAAAAAGPDCDIIVFMDGDGADRADLLDRLVTPIETGAYDFVIAARVRQWREPGSMSLHQVVAGHVLGAAIGLLTGIHYTDMCAFRAIKRDALNRLGLREMTYGWNIEMQIEAAGMACGCWKFHYLIVAGPAENRKLPVRCAERSRRRRGSSRPLRGLRCRAAAPVGRNRRARFRT